MNALILILIAWVTTCCGYNQDYKGPQDLRWAKYPIKVYIHESWPEEYKQDITDAINVWESVVHTQLFEVSTETVYGPLRPRQDALNVFYFKSQEWEREKTEQGYTRVYNILSTIQEGDIIINGYNFKYYTFNNPRNAYGLPYVDKVHMRSLLIHELGHLLGLGHTESKDSVMNHFLPMNTIRDELYPQDVEALYHKLELRKD
jgi:hypothetical protein